MTAQQVYRLAREWSRAQGKPIGPFLDHYAQVYDLTPAQVREVRALAEEPKATR